MWKFLAIFVPSLIGLAFSPAQAAEAVTNPRDCPTVTSTRSICSTCLPLGCVIATRVPCHRDCVKPVPTMNTRFPCGERCPGACSTSYEFELC
ncbi:hypothetical protein CP532_4899 [Ophiocordyceps camponoti-leonardi (nom. inval.)]|nr:hypothetical protein CP532_4899 [Ophiocordyceps camponoti-leonardi (nom. inval.)]